MFITFHRLFIHDQQLSYISHTAPLPRSPTTCLSPQKDINNSTYEVLVQSFLKPIKIRMVLMLA